MADGYRPEKTTTAQVAETHLAPALAGIMERHADQPALGERAAERTTDPATGRTTRQLLPHFDTITYGQLQERVNAVAADWHHAAHSPLQSGDFVCLLGFTSIDYTTLDLACMHLGAVAVPASGPAFWRAAWSTRHTVTALLAGAVLYLALASAGSFP